MDEEIEAAFKIFDTDDSGEISIDELRLVLKGLDKNLTDEEVCITGFKLSFLKIRGPNSKNLNLLKFSEYLLRHNFYYVIP